MGHLRSSFVSLSFSGKKIVVTPQGKILIGSGQVQNQSALYSVDALIARLGDPTHSFGKENVISIFKTD